MLFMSEMGLDKYTVIDFTDAAAGPICAEYLGFFGMNVIRVDHPSAEEMRRDEKYYFVANNLNKRCVTLDYETEEGRKLLFRMLEKADVIVESKPFGFMEELGCGYEALKAVNPGIVYCSIKPYTKESPWANAAWTPTTVDAMGGATYLTGYVGGIPTEPGPQLSNLSACGYATTGILGALWQRETSGKGQYIEVSMQDAVIAHARSAYEKYAMNGIVTRVGNNFPTLPEMVPMDIFRTKGEGPEDWAMIGCMGDKMVNDLYEAMGRPELAQDPRFDSFDSRLENKAELLDIIKEFALKHEKNDIMEYLLGEKRLVCAAVCTTRDVIYSEDLKKIGFVHTINDEELGDMNLPGCAGIFHGVDPVPIVSPGRPGDANEEVFRELFGDEKKGAAQR